MAFTEVIKFEGYNDYLVWKHPVEDFNTNDQLIVHETQEAMVYKNGEAMKLYKPGRYTIETDNIPIINSVLKFWNGGISPNHCEVFFINTAYNLDVDWGTSSPTLVQDPDFQVPLLFGANGKITLKVTDSRKLMLNIASLKNDLSRSDLVNEYFAGLLTMKVASYISSLMVGNRIGFQTISIYLEEIAKCIKEHVSSKYLEHGVEVVDLFVEGINIVNDDTYFPVYSNKVVNAYGDRATYSLFGTSRDKERAYDILQAQAENTGTSGAIAGAGVGLGIGVGAGHAMGNMMGQALGNITNVLDNPKHEKNMGENNFGIVIPKKNITGINDDLTCPKCKKSIKKDFASCPYCRTELSEQKTNCKNCGKEIESDFSVCPYCSTEV